MHRRNFYQQLTNEQMGSFYYYIQENIQRGNLTEFMNYELQLIKEVAAKRGISLVELRIIGYWAIQREKNHIDDEK